jgi:hypothetical protein
MLAMRRPAIGWCQGAAPCGKLRNLCMRSSFAVHIPLEAESVDLHEFIF